MRAKTYYVIFSTGYQVSKGKMRKNEEFSEEFSVLSENSSPAPHCSSFLKNSLRNSQFSVRIPHHLLTAPI